MTKSEPLVVHTWSASKKNAVEIFFYVYCVANLVIMGIYMGVAEKPKVKGATASAIKPNRTAFADRESLLVAVDDYVSKNGVTNVTSKYGPSIADWNVSAIQDFSNLFSASRNPLMKMFNANLTAWNMSKATTLSGMFEGAELFNSPLPWDTSKVTTMSGMFDGAETFIGTGVGNWSTGAVTDMSSMFKGALKFDADLSKWNVGSVTTMKKMFHKAASFTGKGVELWNVSNVESMRYMFSQCPLINPDLSSWVTSKVIFFAGMFEDADAFEGKGLSGWDVSNAIETNFMFANTLTFNADLSAWNVAKVEKFDAMFFGSIAFQGTGVTGWTRSDTASFQGMFCNAAEVNIFIKSEFPNYDCGDGVFESGNDDQTM